MATSNYLERQLELAQRALDEALAKQQAAEAAKEAEQQRLKASKTEVQRVLNEYLKKMVETGKFNQKLIQAFWQRYEGDVQFKYVELVANLLTSKLYGLEPLSTKLANGNLRWNGKDYANPQELYKQFQDILGDSPIASKQWFLQLLQTDHDELAVDLRVPDKFTTYYNYLKRHHFQDTLPEVSLTTLTTEDKFFMESLGLLPSLG